jgi:hypothetical protein
VGIFDRRVVAAAGFIVINRSASTRSSGRARISGVLTGARWLTKLRFALSQGRAAPHQQKAFPPVTVLRVRRLVTSFRSHLTQQRPGSRPETAAPLCDRPRRFRGSASSGTRDLKRNADDRSACSLRQIAYVTTPLPSSHAHNRRHLSG